MTMAMRAGDGISQGKKSLLIFGQAGKTDALTLEVEGRRLY